MKLLITHGDGWASIDLIGDHRIAKFVHHGDPTPLQLARKRAEGLAVLMGCKVEEASVCTKCGELCKECEEDLRAKAGELTEVKDEK